MLPGQRAPLLGVGQRFGGALRRHHTVRREEKAKKTVETEKSEIQTALEEAEVQTLHNSQKIIDPLGITITENDIC